jgi:hypothetical protein
MNTNKLYLILLILFPFVYIFHNLEEWLELRYNALAIVNHIPKQVSNFLPTNPEELVSIFAIASIVATVIPLVLSAFMWGRVTKFRVNLLTIIAFATLFNAMSHITSSAFLGFASPGLITALALSIPYFIGVMFYTIKFGQINFTRLIVLGIVALPVYLTAIIVSWLVAIVFWN